MKTWIGEAVVYLGSLTSEEIKDPKHKVYFKDTDNPTEEELAKFFEKKQTPELYPGYGNPINEMADASIGITETTEEVEDSEEEED
jgi:hypothetical protein